MQAIDTAAVIGVLRPIWTEKTETASRVRQRIEAVLDYAKALGRRSGENPARWKGHLDHLLPEPSKVSQVEHHAGARLARGARVHGRAGEARRHRGAKALAFAILTAARSGEVRGMTWGEVDDDAGVWTDTRRPHEGGQGAPGAAHAGGAGAARRARSRPTRWCSRARRMRPSRSPTWR